MEDSRATVLNTGLSAVLDWIRSNRLVFVGALTTIFGLIASVGTVYPLVLEGLNLPVCLTYANTYRKPESYFKHEGKVWHEYFPPDGSPFRYEFSEVRRTRDTIDLLNQTPRPEERNWASMIVRLPVCGGTAKLILGVPEHTIDLAEVWRE
ncbi:hypothetical protein SAMN05444159_0421 [Bradyrhizobium lablabi]|uniref:Uncharacterized protein n=1 Tax=Bradyrhizobium lablabi TaxID=722472 RepID=A0A1M6IP06_9BRAD|nr:hypothetical protein [Bradyrhizobium lablabi]SHJ36172.1 hypothetical protein SAMN05444159_0421 [Bradyrhizobium lablabi]